jgi:hypothetical protein
MTILKIDTDKVKPAFNEKNWKVVSQDKVEIIRGEMYTGMDQKHWFFPMINKTKSSTDLGFYTNTNKPNELVRVAGLAPDLWVITFKKV